MAVQRDGPALGQQPILHHPGNAITATTRSEPEASFTVIHWRCNGVYAAVPWGDGMYKTETTKWEVQQGIILRGTRMQFHHTACTTRPVNPRTGRSRASSLGTLVDGLLVDALEELELVEGRRDHLALGLAPLLGGHPQRLRHRPTPSCVNQ
jgi:hypothetical protein